jgi:hypothetical protein
MIDLDILARQARAGCAPIIEAVRAKGVSLYGSDDDGNLIEIAPDGRKYLATISGNRPIRGSEIRIAAPIDQLS